MRRDVKAAMELLGKEGFRVRALDPTPDELAENWMGQALLALRLSRDAVREGGSYHKADCLATARALLDEIEASAKPKKRRAA